MLEEIEFDPSQFSLPQEPVRGIDLPDAEATRRLGASLGKLLESGDFLGLIGQLGSGKTTLVGGLLEELGSANAARSPTYTLVNVHETTPPLYHVDLYRLEDVDDLESIGYWDYVSAADGILCVEWLDRVPEAWPGQGVIAVLAYRDQGRRVRLYSSENHRDRIDAIPGTFGGSA